MSTSSDGAAARYTGRPHDGAPGRNPDDVEPYGGDRGAFWRRSLASWDQAFAVLMTIVAVMSLVSGSTPTQKAISLGALAVIVVAYLTLARPGARRDDRRLTNAYLVLLVVATSVQVPAVQLGAVLLFVSFSHIWFFASGRTMGTLWCVALAVGVVGGELVGQGLDPAALPELAGSMAIALVFAIGLGLWITTVSERSEVRAELLDQLRAAQNELAASHHAAGVLAERERMAQEIHDTLAQGFTSVVMLAQTTSAELDRGRPDAARARVEQIERVARDNLAEARALVAAFGPAGLQDATLVEALARLADRFTAETGVRVDVPPSAAAAAAGLGRDQEVVLLRAAQEALANVRRHAAATRVTLTLTRTGDEVRLEVTDDGRGIPDGTPDGHGLRGMRERARGGGGDLRVGPGPGAGTRVALTLPVAVRPDRDDDREGTP